MSLCYNLVGALLLKICSKILSIQVDDNLIDKEILDKDLVRTDQTDDYEIIRCSSLRDFSVVHRGG